MRPSLRLTVFLFSFLICLNLCISQSKQLFLIPSKTKAEIPFDLINGFIVVKGTLNGKHEVNLLVDTGAENLILFDPKIKKKMQLPAGKKIKLKGADLITEVSAEIARNIKLKLPNTNEVNKDIIILDENEMNLSGALGYPIDGLIGGRVFWGLILEIDYTKQKLILRDKSTFSPPSPKKFRKFDLEISNYKPYFEAQIKMYSGSATPIKLLLDTGSSLGFMLFYNSHPSLYLPDNHLEGELGRGLGGSITGYISQTKMLMLGSNLYFKNLVTNFQGQNLDLNPELYNGRNGLIGNPLLARFKVIIDYVGHTLYLKPNKNYNKALAYDKSGLVLFASGKDLQAKVEKS